MFDSAHLVASLVQGPTCQHHWPGLLTPLASSTGSHHWSAPLAGIIGQDPWQHVPNTSMMMTMTMLMMMLLMMSVTMMMMMMMMMLTMMMMRMMMIMMMMMMLKVIVMVGQHHWPALLTPLASSTGHHRWSAPLAGVIGRDPSQRVPHASVVMTMVVMMLMMMIVAVMMVMMAVIVVMVMVMVVVVMVSCWFVALRPPRADYMFVFHCKERQKLQQSKNLSFLCWGPTVFEDCFLCFSSLS